MNNWNPDSRLTTAQLAEELKKTKKVGGSSPTSALTRAALAVLHLNGFTAWRQNNAAVYDAKLKQGAGGYRAGSAKRGVSDIIGLFERGAVWCAVEVKIGSDELSDEQRAFLTTIHDAGGFAFECRDSVDELQAAARAWVIARKAGQPAPPLALSPKRVPRKPRAPLRILSA